MPYECFYFLFFGYLAKGLGPIEPTVVGVSLAEGRRRRVRGGGMPWLILVDRFFCSLLNTLVGCRAPVA